MPGVLADIVYLDTCQAALLTFVAVNNGSTADVERGVVIFPQKNPQSELELNFRCHAVT